ncbi:Uncharacterised protein [Klebsiella pneumoniae]|nr:Uncharacterised protein [Klebsiella pneumoniae]
MNAGRRAGPQRQRSINLLTECADRLHRAIHRPIDLLAVGQQCHSRRRRLDPTSGSLQQPGL